MERELKVDGDLKVSARSKDISNLREADLIPNDFQESLAKTALMTVIFLLLLCIAAFRPVGSDRDSEGYARIIEGSSVKYAPDYRALEPSFWLITVISRKLFPNNPVRSVLFVYALLGIGLKFVAIYRSSRFRFMSLYVYFGTYFFLHEITEIRAGVASAFLLLSIQSIAQKNLRNFLLKACSAIVFHYQAVVIIPFFFLNSRRVDKVFYSLLPIIGIAFSLTKFLEAIFRYLVRFLPGVLSFRLNNYLILQERGVFSELNVLRSTYMYALLILYYSVLHFSDRMTRREEVVSLKILGWGIFFYYSLSFLPVLSVRISEFLIVTIVIVLPSLLGLLKERVLPFLAVVMFTSARLISFLFLYQLFLLK